AITFNTVAVTQNYGQAQFFAPYMPRQLFTPPST
ncbi:hypothetical protein YPPY01_2429, partial [Yersinia pestis PY-01]